MGCDNVVIGEIGPHTDWHHALKDVSVVVHLAARVHVMNEASRDPLSEYRRINLGGTVILARQAAECGIKQFIFISTIKVNGELSLPNHPFSENDLAAPESDYGISKYEAERALWRINKRTGLPITIIRPPLVYGSGAAGHLNTIRNWILKGLPVPLKSVKNKRSFIGVENLVDFIVTCIANKKAYNQVFLVSDGQDLSTAGLFEKIGDALGKPAWLIPCSVRILSAIATILGKESVGTRLFSSLQIDSSKACNALGWTPPVTPEEGFRKAFDKYAD